jgi:signal transduction histidine kinase/ActR/RegA family two-component response regulator
LIERLVPRESRGEHVAYRTHFHDDSRQRPMGAGRDLHILRRDGSSIPVEIGLSPIETVDGTYVIAAVTDISERKRAEQAERQAREDAERANRAKDEFLAVLSHELRNPINAILGWAQMLRSGLSPELTAQGLEVIERNARGEAQLVESLLDVSRITSGKLKLEMELVDLVAVVQAALDVVKPTADLKGVRIMVLLPASPVIITGDAGRLQQILWNLFSNAIKFTPRGGQVQVTLSVRESRAVVLVSDDGEGIAEEFLPHIFGRFTQADGGKARTHGGLGLGLAIVRELVHAHGGAVTAESPGTGLGSTFTLTLPIAALAPAAADGAATADARQLPAIAGLRVLVVDDDADARNLLKLTLSAHGAVVQPASSASEALEMLRHGLPDALIADIGMPGVDGYALIRKVRVLPGAGPMARLLPAIALTAYATPSDRDEALAAGFDLHLAKPVEPAELVRAIASLQARLVAP